MYKRERHYVRNATRQRYKNKQTFYFVWKLVRLRDMLTRCTNHLTNRLNDCGWLFKYGDLYHKIYQDYQKKEELNRLVSYAIDQIKDGDSAINSEQKQYAVFIAEMMCNMIHHYGKELESNAANKYINRLKLLSK